MINITFVGRILILIILRLVMKRAKMKKAIFVASEVKSGFRQREGYASEFCLSIQIAFPAYE